MLSPQYQQIYTPPQEYQPQHQYPFPPPQGNTPTATPEPVLRPVWRIAAAVSPNILLLGYLMLPVAFKGRNDDPPVDRSAITTAAFSLIAFAYVLSFGVGFIQRRNGFFVVQRVFLPGLYSSILSLFNVVFNIIARDLLPLNTLEKAGIGLSSTFGVVYAVAALCIYAKDVVAYCGTGTGTGSTNDNPVELLTEEEMQRRQLSSLLEQRKKDGLKSPSSRTVQKKTFRVDGPEHLNVGSSEWDRYKR